MIHKKISETCQRGDDLDAQTDDLLALSVGANHGDDCVLFDVMRVRSTVMAQFLNCCEHQRAMVFVILEQICHKQPIQSNDETQAVISSEFLAVARPVGVSRNRQKKLFGDDVVGISATSSRKKRSSLLYGQPGYGFRRCGMNDATTHGGASGRSRLTSVPKVRAAKMVVASVASHKSPLHVSRLSTTMQNALSTISVSKAATIC